MPDILFAYVPAGRQYAEFAAVSRVESGLELSVRGTGPNGRTPGVIADIVLPKDAVRGLARALAAHVARCDRATGLAAAELA